jgi:predicted O-methyltransferase YrrM
MHKEENKNDLHEALAKKPDWVGGNINAIDVQFLGNLIEKVKPVNIIEIGVASGFSSSIMIASAISNRADFKTLKAFDLFESYYLDSSRKTGACVYDMIPDNLELFDLRTGVITAEIDAIELNEFEFAFIDANHMHPWASLDLLAIIPFLKENSWVALHDIFLNTVERHKHKNRGPYYLFNLYQGLKEMSSNDPATIGAVFIQDKNKIAKMLIEILYTPWEVSISTDHCEKFIDHISKYYDSEISLSFNKMLINMRNN